MDEFDYPGIRIYTEGFLEKLKQGTYLIWLKRHMSKMLLTYALYRTIIL